MPALPSLAQRVAVAVTTAAWLLGVPASTQAAQENPPCPFTTDSIVAGALGSPVHGYATGTTPGFESCEFGDFTIYHQSGPGVANTPGVAGLAQNVVLSLPPEVAGQVVALGAGRSIDLPRYQIASPSDLGDAALWVKDSSFGVDALVIQRGGEVFVLQVLDRPDALATSIALGRAVVSGTAAAPPPVAPTGGRASVGTDCGLDVANAVADRLQRADVTEINVIGGCHLVYITTTLDGSGVGSALTGRQICDAAIDAAYTSDAIQGVFVTDRLGHDRAASPGPGQPCDGFP